MDVEGNRKKALYCGLAALALVLALGCFLCLGIREDVRDQRNGTDAARRELERAVERERRAAGEAMELAGDAERHGDEIGSVREELEDAQREAGLALEGIDYSDVLIGECQQIIAGVRGRGAKDETAH